MSAVATRAREAWKVSLFGMDLTCAWLAIIAIAFWSKDIDLRFFDDTVAAFTYFRVACALTALVWFAVSVIADLTAKATT